MENDLELIKRAREGDNLAFRELVEANKRNVFYLAFDLTGSREDAEDISQEVFIKAFRSLNKFQGESKFSTWIYRITVNTCFSLKSKKWYSALKPEENMTDIIDKDNRKSNENADSNPERKTNSGFIKNHLQKAMRKLSEREHSVFVMRNMRELLFDEIAKVLQLHPGTVRKFNFRALQKLRKELSFYKNEFEG
ncbi:MAG: sigma-70 family RNA polymerase sigma factor [Melioribacteraceae bacterium]|nr:sigma-70 family RNA polymerase sigma factor [Melioribacteraceae bacterium]MCF8262992.1 sigma-70 family RNA polymerase sigma factor [Melioribacteraceae bacterium]MCF8430575.1 sigma-70 family RNA polymerase sigma factor [Melioribacteraceae bacterium]